MTKTAVITGSTKGIGRACAEKLLKEGYFVFINYAQDDKTAESLQCELDADYGGKRFQIVKADLSSEQGVMDLYCKVFEMVDKLDVLILNAGATNRKSLNEITYKEWEYVMNVNLNIPFETVRKFQTKINEGGYFIYFLSAWQVPSCCVPAI